MERTYHFYQGSLVSLKIEDILEENYCEPNIHDGFRRKRKGLYKYGCLYNYTFTEPILANSDCWNIITLSSRCSILLAVMVFIGNFRKTKKSAREGNLVNKTNTRIRQAEKQKKYPFEMSIFAELICTRLPNYCKSF